MRFTRFAEALHNAANAARRLRVAMQVRKERRMLMRLDERALKDLGFDKSRAQGEANRSFWDVPVDRLRG
jgi:uncharacterized protein YjiS (DUF1127 family)